MADSTLNIHINTGGAKKNLDGVNASLKDTEQQSKKTESSVDKLNGTVKRLAGVLVAGGLLKSIFTLTGNFQEMSYTLGVVYKSMEEGNAVFRDLQAIAVETPFQIEDLTQSVIKLKSAGLDPTKEMLATFADVAAVTTDQVGTLQAVTDLFSRSLAGGLGLEDLNRLADRGIPVFKMLQDELGLTRLEVSEFGKTAEGATQILSTLYSRFEKDFAGAAANASKNLNAEISNVQIAIKQLFDAIAGGNATTLLASTIGAISTAVKFAAENVDVLVVAFGVLATAAIPSVIAGLKAIAAILIANPFGVMVVAIAAAATAIYHFRDDIYEVFAVSLPNAIDAALVKLTEWRIAVRDFIGKDANDLRDKVIELGAAMSARTTNFEDNGAPEWLDKLQQAMARATDSAKGLASERTLLEQLKDIGDASKTAATGVKALADEQDKLKSQAESLTLSLRTSGEVFADTVAQLDLFMEKGLITVETYNRGIQAAATTMQNSMDISGAVEQADKGLDDLRRSIEGFSRNAANSFVDMTKGVEGAFGRMVQTMIDELIRLMAQMLLFDPIFKSFGGWMGGIAGGIGIGSAGAGAGSVTAFGSGGVVSGATPFGFSGGRAGVAGEAGPEAILPLTRTSSGDLGVKAGGASPKVTVNVNNQTAGQADVAVTSSPSGDSIDIMITSAVAAGIAGGRFDSAFKSTYGLRRRGF